MVQQRNLRLGCAPSMIQPTVQEMVLLFIRQRWLLASRRQGMKAFAVEDIADDCGVSPGPAPGETLKQL